MILQNQTYGTYYVISRGGWTSILSQEKKFPIFFLQIERSRLLRLDLTLSYSMGKKQCWCLLSHITQWIQLECQRRKEGKENYSILGFSTTYMYLTIEIGSLGHSLPGAQRLLWQRLPSLKASCKGNVTALEWWPFLLHRLYFWPDENSLGIKIANYSKTQSWLSLI